MRPWLLIFVIALLPAGALAKPLSQIIRETGLTPEDFNMVMAAERDLTQSPREGQVVSWTNPDSGAKGSAKLVALRNDCAFIQHYVYRSDADRPNEIRTRWCQQADGAWLRIP